MSKQKVTIGIDVDGVLRDFNAKVMEIANREFPSKVKSQVTNSWDYSNIDIPTDLFRHIWMDSKFCREIYRDAPVINNVRQGLAVLQAWCENSAKYNIELVIATHQHPGNESHTLYWLGLHDFNFRKVYVDACKHTLPIDYLIDDSGKNYEDWIKSGRREECFILVNRPWNRDCKASRVIDSLDESIVYLKKDITLQKLFV